MEMKYIRMLSAQCVFVCRISLIFIMCGGLAVSQESSALLGNDVDQMTPVQLRALPDSAMLRYKGQTLTKSAFIELRLKEFQAKAKNVSRKEAVSFEILKAQFQQKQAAALAEKNAAVEAVMQNLNTQRKQVESSPAFIALAKESAGILGRYPGSNSAQQLELRQRALEIHNQLLRMETHTASPESK
jgi:hypothetical protein